jgi:hypothetical protein
VSIKPTTRFSGVLKNTRELPATADPEPLREEIRQRSIGRPTGKKTDPTYRQVTVYLQDHVHRTARKLLLDERKQFSDLVNELVSEWVNNRISDAKKSRLPEVRNSIGN